MNRIPAIVESVKKDELFAQVGVNFAGLPLSACVLLADQELPYCKVGALVDILFKEADTIISLDCNATISCRNCFKVCITDICQTGVMARVTADTGSVSLTSLITRRSRDTLGLTNGMIVWYLVKSTSCMLTMRA
ncbi:MAG: TOBE domain-containing protein [Fibrobacter sp.]|nr:TOBE domain-containing protein [Fibrobacter sp.]